MTTRHYLRDYALLAVDRTKRQSLNALSSNERKTNRMAHKISSIGGSVAVGRAAKAVLTGAAGLGLCLGMQGQAQAASITVQVTGGYGEFNQDPSAEGPGDAVRACDTKSDGWGVEVEIDIHNDGTVDREIDTRGHNSPYCTPWATGDIVEGTVVKVIVYQVKGSDIGGGNSWITNA